MNEGPALTSTVSPVRTDPATGHGVSPTAAADGEWLAALRDHGSGYDAAVRHVHELVHRAARRQISRIPSAWADLGAVRAEEIIHSAADEATVAVLEHLDDFQGRSRFSTWVYKFGVYQAATEARRALWRDRALTLDGDRVDTHPMTPASYTEAHDLADAVAVAIRTVLTAHQRRVVLALLIDEIPIDVLAERLGTSRNTLYKALHDARVRLRDELRQRGYLPDPQHTMMEVTS